MSNDPVLTKRPLIDNKRILIILIATLVAITLIYQLRPFLDDSHFAWKCFCLCNFTARTEEYTIKTAGMTEYVGTDIQAN